MSMSIRFSIGLGITLAIITVSCNPHKAEKEIELPTTSVLSINSTWGVVKSNYLRMRAGPSRSAEVLDGLTKGTVVEILSSTEEVETIEDETSYWYRVNLEGLKGWVFGHYLELADSKERADSLAKEMK